MPSFPGPYQVEIDYTVFGRTHKLRVELQLDSSPVAGTDPATLNAVTKSGGTVNLVTAVTALVDLIKPQFEAAATFNSFILWKFVSGTNQKSFIGSATLGISGTSGNSGVVAHYSMFTFRSSNGGIAKLVMLEDSQSGNSKTTYANMGSVRQAIADYCIGPGSWIYARDNGYPVAVLFESQGQNESVWRKIYR